jgi:hypothetical protein
MDPIEIYWSIGCVFYAYLFFKSGDGFFMDNPIRSLFLMIWFIGGWPYWLVVLWTDDHFF